jgi:hypothetical protein
MILISDDMDYEMNFIYVNERSFTFNEAIDVCTSMNATLLTLRSWYKWFTIQQLHNSSWGWDAVPYVKFLQSCRLEHELNRIDMIKTFTELLYKLKQLYLCLHIKNRGSGRV